MLKALPFRPVAPQGHGLAYCEWVTTGDWNCRYFGKWGTDEAEQGYTRFQLEWATRLVRRAPVVPGQTIAVCQLVEAWLDYCETGDDGEGGLTTIRPDPARPAVASFRGWLRASTFNACHDFHTRKGTRPLPAPDGLSSADAGEAVSEVVEANDRRTVVRSALELIRPEFSEQTWAAFTGIAIQERPAAEVAAELGITKNAVHLARNRVLTRLRAGFGEFLE